MCSAKILNTIILVKYFRIEERILAETELKGKKGGFSKFSDFFLLFFIKKFYKPFFTIFKICFVFFSYKKIDAL